MSKINHNVLVFVSTKDKNKLLFKIYENGIDIKNINYTKDGIEFETDIDSLKKLKKNLKSYKFIVKKNVGVYLLFSILKRNRIFLINTILFLLLIYIFSNTIVSVKVIHSKKYIRDIVNESLKENGIKVLSWKKDYKELNKIRKKILDKYPKNLEWLEIEKKGMIYTVRVEERIITDIKKEKKSCHLVAKKDAMIMKIKYDKGQEILNVGDYVKEGDIIVSGEIKYNDEVKNVVCASGEVRGEVWYASNVNIPLNYKEERYTGKKRYNIAFNNSKIFKSRLKEYETKKKRIFGLFGNNIYLLEEKEIKFTSKKYSEQEAINEAMRLTSEKIKMKLNEKECIISQKVLKNSVNNSTMYVEIFSSVEEIISKQVEFIEEEKEVE